MVTGLLGGRRRWIMRAATYAGGGIGGLGAIGALGYGLLWSEAKLARREIGTPTESAPVPPPVFGPDGERVLRLAVLGDSSAAGFGAADASGTPGALLSTELAAASDSPVQLTVAAVVGARSQDLREQVEHLLRDYPAPDVAVLMIGVNDVTHMVSADDACRDLDAAVRTLRAAGVEVVAGTCPDLARVKPLRQPLRAFVGWRSRQMAAAQAVVAAEAGGVAVPLGQMLGEVFAADDRMWSPDRFHPSALGYQRLAAALLPAVRAAVGLETLAEAARETARVLGDVGERLDPARAAQAARAAARDSGEQEATARGGRFGVLRRLVRRGGDPDHD